jgi:hypothetical protein
MRDISSMTDGQFDALIEELAGHRDICPKCDGNGGWYIDEQGYWNIAPSGYGDDVWAICLECGGEGML